MSKNKYISPRLNHVLNQLENLLIWERPESRPNQKQKASPNEYRADGESEKIRKKLPPL